MAASLAVSSLDRCRALSRATFDVAHLFHISCGCLRHEEVYPARNHSRRHEDGDRNRCLSEEFVDLLLGSLHFAIEGAFLMAMLVILRGLSLGGGGVYQRMSIETKTAEAITLVFSAISTIHRFIMAIAAHHVCEYLQCLKQTLQQ